MTPVERWTVNPMLHQAIDDRLNLLVGGALLHYH